MRAAEVYTVRGVPVSSVIERHFSAKVMNESLQSDAADSCTGALPIMCTRHCFRMTAVSRCFSLSEDGDTITIRFIIKCKVCVRAVCQ